MEPPSAELMRSLTELGLAFGRDRRGRDIQRCRGYVRRMGRGLPAYDSLWLDALVHHGRLTPFQARLLEQRRGAELRVGDRLVLESLRYADPCMPLYAAREIESRERFLVTQFDVSPADADRCETDLSRIGPPADVMGYVRDGTRFHVVLRFAEGQTLGRLLVRRGRFPEAVVRAVAMELAGTLAAGEGAYPHGDLRLSNILLSDRGRVRLLNWGVLSAMVPVVTIHTPLPVDACDGIAPERIAEGAGPSNSADVYAFGCLLWQLLAGRPPFPMADPLAKLTAHQQRQVPDVRTLAPYTSAPLAQLLRRMTFPEPDRRPRDFSEVLAALEPKRMHSRRRMKRFAQSFESAAPRPPVAAPVSRKFPVVQASLATAATIGLALLAWNRETVGIPSLSNLDAAVSTGANEQENAAPQPAGRHGVEHPTRADSSMQPLPVRDEQGVVILERGGIYGEGNIQTDGPLTLRGDPEDPPTIRLGRSSLLLEAPQVTLENVVIVTGGETGMNAPESEPAQIVIRTPELNIRRCHVRSETEPETRAFAAIVDANSSDRGPSGPAVIEWTPGDVADPEAGRLLVTDSFFETASTALLVRGPLTAGLLEHVYKQGTGPLIELRSGVRSGLKVPLVLHRCTLRRSGPLVRFSELDRLPRSGRLSLQGEDTLLDLADDAGMFELHGPEVPRQWDRHVEVFAQGLIAPPGVMLVTHRPDGEGDVRELSANGMTVDGLLTGEFRFHEAPSALSPVPDVAIDSLPVRLSAETPGADRSRMLPVRRGTTAASRSN
jgi:eukaryotic-like serine/threonine-protein kinase